MADFDVTVRIWNRHAQFHHPEFSTSMLPYTPLEGVREFVRPLVHDAYDIERSVVLHFTLKNGLPLVFFNGDLLEDIATLELFLSTASIDVVPQPPGAQPPPAQPPGDQPPGDQPPQPPEAPPQTPSPQGSDNPGSPLPISSSGSNSPHYNNEAMDLVRSQDYLSSTAITGLKTLRLMHDCAATALGYGIYKTDLSFPTHVVFIDIRHCDTQVSVVSFETGHMRVVAHAFDRSLGGRDFDEVLFCYFVEQFKEQYHIDVYSNIKACIRLRAACEKLKKVLNANAEAPLNIECLMEEKEVKGSIKRGEFEKLSSGLLERMSLPCYMDFADAGLTVDSIHSVELVGSGSRVPAIGRMLSSLFKREPCRTLNVSECVARGCALQCAMLSPIYRVRDYEVQDSYPFSVGLSSEEGPICTVSNGIISPKDQPIPSLKILTVHRNNMFRLEAFYADQSKLPTGISLNISSFTIGPFQVSHAEKAKIKARVLLNLHGIVTVKSASALRNYCYDVKDPMLAACSEKQLTQVDGRVLLDAPPLKAGQDQDCIPRNGRWSFHNKWHYEPMKITQWAVAYFSGHCDISHLSRELINCGRNKGIGTSCPAHYNVLLEEIGVSADELQNLVHSLSYV